MSIEKIKHEHVCDLAVIGSGPAGMTAALYAARAGLDVILFESIAEGGQLANAELVENYPGFPEGIEGFELADSMKKQCDHFGVRSIGEEVLSTNFSEEVKILKTSFGSYQTKSVIVATGTRPRKLGLEFEDELRGRGLSYCATCDGNFFSHKDVMVVGGGNVAAQDALYLARIVRKVYLVHRQDKLRATDVYCQGITEFENIEPRWFTVPSKLITQEGKLAGVQITEVKTGKTEDVECSALFVAIGTVPNTEFVKNELKLDESGYVIADERGKTLIPGVFVAGDIRAKALKQVVTAVADGANAAEMAAEYLLSCYDSQS